MHRPRPQTGAQPTCSGCSGWGDGLTNSRARAGSPCEPVELARLGPCSLPSPPPLAAPFVLAPPLCAAPMLGEGRAMPPAARLSECVEASSSLAVTLVSAACMPGQSARSSLCSCTSKSALPQL